MLLKREPRKGRLGIDFKRVDGVRVNGESAKCDVVKLRVVVLVVNRVSVRMKVGRDGRRMDLGDDYIEGSGWGGVEKVFEKCIVGTMW